MAAIDKVLAAILEEEKQHRNLAPAWGDVHTKCADEWREAAEQVLAMQQQLSAAEQREAVLRECLELYANTYNWVTATRFDAANVWSSSVIQDGCEPAQAALAKVEGMGGGA